MFYTEQTQTHTKSTSYTKCCECPQMHKYVPTCLHTHMDACGHAPLHAHTNLWHHKIELNENENENMYVYERNRFRPKIEKPTERNRKNGIMQTSTETMVQNSCHVAHCIALHSFFGLDLCSVFRINCLFIRASYRRWLCGDHRIAAVKTENGGRIPLMVMVWCN